jgi:hypothetical protein
VRSQNGEDRLADSIRHRSCALRSRKRDPPRTPFATDDSQDPASHFAKPIRLTRTRNRFYNPPTSRP